MFEIGPVKIKNNVCSAPMAGFTDLAYRNVAREFGCGICWSELIMARGLVEGNRKTMDLLKTDCTDKPLAVQLGGAEPEFMATAAQIAQDNGADIIDINCGCPVPKMVKRGYGAGLMKTPETIGRIVSAVKKKVSVPVTVKMRAGFNKANATCVQAAQISQSEGASALIVHGRYRDEFFRGESDWNFIKDVKSAVSIPVIGNGDIRNANDARRMFESTACDAVMVGRGSLGNPWIFREIVNGETREVSSSGLLRTIKKHANLLVLQYGEKNGCFKLRSLLCYYTKGLRNIRHLRAEIIKIHDMKSFSEILNKIQETLIYNEYSPAERDKL